VDDRLIEWLSDRLRGRGDLTGSLELEERLFWKYPNLEKYKKLHKLANQLNRASDAIAAGLALGLVRAATVTRSSTP